jgi:hypothetical protein
MIKIINFKMTLEERLSLIENEDNVRINLDKAFSQPSFDAKANRRNLPYLKDDLTVKIADFLIERILILGLILEMSYIIQ